MTGTSVFIQSLFDCRDTSLVGGKAANLGRLLRTGFSVPEGFVVTTHAYRSARTHAKIEGIPSDMPHDVAEEIRLAYRAMGGVGAALRAAWTLDRNTITVPIARLPFADQMNLDLALSEEVSRRTGGAEV